MRVPRPFLIRNKYLHRVKHQTLYKSLPEPIWTYGLQLWGTVKKTNTTRIQAFQNASRLSHAPPFISDVSLHNDFRIKTTEYQARNLLHTIPQTAPKPF